MTSLKSRFQELLKHREILRVLVSRDIRIRYKQSVMGFFWALLLPMLIVASGIMVKKAMAVLTGKPLDLQSIVTVSVKAIVWSFFVSAVKFATSSLLGNRSLVTKIYFPREVFPLASVISSLFDFSVASTTLIILLAVAGVGLSLQLLWVPLLLVMLILLTAGLGLLLSCANLFFRDVKYIVEVILTFGIFFTPVLYEAAMFGPYEPLLLLNPVAPILEAVNAVVVHGRHPNLFWIGYSAMWAVGLFLFSWVFFYRIEHRFAERI